MFPSETAAIKKWSQDQGQCRYYNSSACTDVPDMTHIQHACM